MKFVYISSVRVGEHPLLQIIQNSTPPSLVISLSKKMEQKTSGYIDYKRICKNSGIENWEVIDLNHLKWIKKLTELKPDLIIVCGWQRLICKEILNLPKYGVIGFHASLLPNFRGRAPINWAIIMGKKHTGVSCFYLEAEADTGDILMQKSFPILMEDDCNTLYDKVSVACSEIITQVLPLVESKKLQTTHNDSRYFPCYPKREPKDGFFTFDRCSLDIYNWIRAQTKPYPGAFFIEDNNKITVWKSKIGNFPEAGIVKKTIDGFITLLDYDKIKLN